MFLITFNTILLQRLQYIANISGLSATVKTSHQNAIISTTSSRHRVISSLDVRVVTSGQTLRHKQSEDVDEDADPARCHLDPDWRPVLAVVPQYCVSWPDVTITNSQSHIIVVGHTNTRPVYQSPQSCTRIMVPYCRHIGSVLTRGQNTCNYNMVPHKTKYYNAH